MFRGLIHCGIVALCLIAHAPICAAQDDGTDNAAALAERDIYIRIINDGIDQLWNVMARPNKRSCRRSIYGCR